jgi:hypothetical protein
MKEGEDRTAGRGAVRPDGRLPYEKPAVAWEQPLEARPSLMAACAKVPAEGEPCQGTGPDSS